MEEFIYLKQLKEIKEKIQNDFKGDIKLLNINEETFNLTVEYSNNKDFIYDLTNVIQLNINEQYLIENGEKFIANYNKDKLEKYFKNNNFII